MPKTTETANSWVQPNLMARSGHASRQFRADGAYDLPLKSIRPQCWPVGSGGRLRRHADLRTTLDLPQTASQEAGDRLPGNAGNIFAGNRFVYTPQVSLMQSGFAESPEMSGSTGECWKVRPVTSLRSAKRCNMAAIWLSAHRIPRS